MRCLRNQHRTDRDDTDEPPETAGVIRVRVCEQHRVESAQSGARGRLSHGRRVRSGVDEDRVPPVPDEHRITLTDIQHHELR